LFEVGVTSNFFFPPVSLVHRGRVLHLWQGEWAVGLLVRGCWYQVVLRLLVLPVQELLLGGLLEPGLGHLPVVHWGLAQERLPLWQVLLVLFLARQELWVRGLLLPEW